MPAPRSVDDLFDLLAASAALDDDEDVSLLTHALECAQELGRRVPADPELQVAGLVHDLGHLARPDDPAAHDRAGSELVRGLLGERVARLVALHVDAKRYLVATDEHYAASLSPRSVETLALEGGPFDPGECERFTLEAGDDLDAVLALRIADEAAKDPHARVRPLSAWRGVVERIVTRGAGGTATEGEEPAGGR